MNINFYQKNGLFYAQIDNMYSNEEVASIKKELIFLETVKESANLIGSATKNGQFLKNGYGVFLDNLYANRNTSTILTLNRKVFDKHIVSCLIDQNCFYEHILRSNRDTTLINFYDNSGNYESHKDASVFTALTFFSIGSFVGGNLVFSDYEVSIEPLEGRTVIFPGCVSHKADPIIAEKNNYRVTMAQFIYYERDHDHG